MTEQFNHIQTENLPGLRKWLSILVLFVAVSPFAVQATEKAQSSSSTSHRIIRSTALVVTAPVEVSMVSGNVKILLSRFNQIKILAKGDILHNEDIVFMDKGSIVTYRLNADSSKTLSADKTPISYTVRIQRK